MRDTIKCLFIINPGCAEILTPKTAVLQQHLIDQQLIFAAIRASFTTFVVHLVGYHCFSRNVDILSVNTDVNILLLLLLLLLLLFLLVK